MKPNKIAQKIYLNTDPVELAQFFLGKKLVTCFEGKLTAGIICETEAYRAPDDKACHAYNNRRTARTETMFQEGGRAYIYLCYGIHHLFNIVTAPEGIAHAILVRGIMPTDGIKTMLQRRGLEKEKTEWCSGPGKLAQALGLHKGLDGISLMESNSLWIEDLGIKVPDNKVECTPRIGVDYAGECAAWPWRFVLKNFSEKNKNPVL